MVLVDPLFDGLLLEEVTVLGSDWLFYQFLSDWACKRLSQVLSILELVGVVLCGNAQIAQRRIQKWLLVAVYFLQLTSLLRGNLLS